MNPDVFVPNKGQEAKNRPFTSAKQQQPPHPPYLLRLWYRLAAPPALEMHQNFVQQDLVRRGRLASIILLFMLVVVGAFIPLALTSINPLLTPIILSLLVLCCVAIWLNRSGRVTLAGLLAMSGISVTIMLNLLTAPQGILTTNGLLTYDLLVLPELVAVSILPPFSVFLVAVINSAFIVGDILLQPHSADLEHLLHASTYTILIRPLALQFVVALVTYLWVSSAVRAIKRADHAEVIARLQDSIAGQKRELEFGIQHIQHTLVQAANGDFTARTPLTQDNVLWQVATSLNMLLTRLQRSQQSEQDLQLIRTEIVRLVAVLYEAELRQLPVRTGPTGTILDPLVRQLLGRYLIPAPPVLNNPTPRK